MREFIPSPLQGEPPIDVTNVHSGEPKIERPPMTLEERLAELERRVAALEDDGCDWT